MISSYEGNPSIIPTSPSQKFTYGIFRHQSDKSPRKRISRKHWFHETKFFCVASESLFDRPRDEYPPDTWSSRAARGLKTARSMQLIERNETKRNAEIVQCPTILSKLCVIPSLSFTSCAESVSRLVQASWPTTHWNYWTRESEWRSQKNKNSVCIKTILMVFISRTPESNLQWSNNRTALACCKWRAPKEGTAKLYQNSQHPWKIPDNKRFRSSNKK